jgi:uncharacterized protein
MANLFLDNNSALYQLKAWGPGQLKVNDNIYTTSIIIAANQLIAPWQAQHVAAINNSSLLAAMALQPKILLIGTGANHEWLAPLAYSELLTQGIGVEIMSTPAACRTFNALSAEQRLVVAALILP